MKKDILKTVGNTPLIRLESTEKQFGLKSRLFAKVEFFNLTGSVKDRSALNILSEATKRKAIKKGDYIVEATSGNMGISLTAIGKKLGYKPVIVIPEGFSEERIDLIKAYGGEVVFTPKSLGMEGAVKKAESLSKSLNGFYVDQFNNKDNALAHYKSTGPEIYKDLKTVGLFIAGIGSGGTITGVSKYLKERTDVKVLGVEPSESPLLSKGQAGPHKIQGIGANFRPSLLDDSLLDGYLTASYEKAKEYTKLLCSLEGLLTGVSSGAAYYAAVDYLLKTETAVDTVIILPDGGLKYMSTGLFKD